MSELRLRSFLVLLCVSLFGVVLWNTYFQRLGDPSVTNVQSVRCESSKIVTPTQNNVDRSNSHFYNEIKIDLIRLAKEIRRAKQHVRGTKTGDALINAKKLVSNLLKTFNISFDRVTEKTVQESESVCPEIYKGSKFGYYFYNTGFVVQNCSYGKPLSELITIVILYDEHQAFDIQTLLRSINIFDNNIAIVLGHMNSNELDNTIRNGFKNLEIMNFQGQRFHGIAWNAMLAKVQTPYTLVARDVMWFNHDARLDRLIRQIERLNVTSAGGAYRNVKGHWFKGCQQRVYRNYTLVYEAGYDESIEECLICDHIDGPFVSKTDQLKGRFNIKIKSQGLFEELFYKFSKSGHVICPDSLFFTNRTERSYDPNDWISFQTQWKVKKIKFSGREIHLPTPPSYGCYGKGKSLTPWCQQENADCLYAAMSVCEGEKLICELHSGSLMGAVKFHSVLPWERDADIFFISNNFTTLANAKLRWTKMGYRLGIKNTIQCCYNYQNEKRKQGGFFALRSKHWRLEMFGMPVLQSEPQFMNNQTATLCNIDGRLVRAPRNPGLFARNRYGKEIYQHAQHWMDTGKRTGWNAYKTNRFIPCKISGGQDCLDRYNGDGNLQFRDPIP